MPAAAADCGGAAQYWPSPATAMAGITGMPVGFTASSSTRASWRLSDANQGSCPARSVLKGPGWFCGGSPSSACPASSTTFPDVRGGKSRRSGPTFWWPPATGRFIQMGSCRPVGSGPAGLAAILRSAGFLPSCKRDRRGKDPGPCETSWRGWNPASGGQSGSRDRSCRRVPAVASRSKYGLSRASQRPLSRP